ncbi:uncharacterized protein LOC133548107, partial [Nerophis ophidion]|uniref:uncharacterized protein LOC133548107 n=1 Tax=Nerophis ophidion TaxID=159077 RepID=UPI002AE077CD
MEQSGGLLHGSRGRVALWGLDGAAAREEGDNTGKGTGVTCPRGPGTCSTTGDQSPPIGSVIVETVARAGACWAGTGRGREGCTGGCTASTTIRVLDGSKRTGDPVCCDRAGLPPSSTARASTQIEMTRPSASRSVSAVSLRPRCVLAHAEATWNGSCQFCPIKTLNLLISDSVSGLVTAGLIPVVKDSHAAPPRSSYEAVVDNSPQNEDVHHHSGRIVVEDEGAGSSHAAIAVYVREDGRGPIPRHATPPFYDNRQSLEYRDIRSTPCAGHVRVARSLTLYSWEDQDLRGIPSARDVRIP